MKYLLLLIASTAIGFIKNKSIFLFGVGVLTGLGFAKLFIFSDQLLVINIYQLDWVAISAIVMAATLFFILKQAKATEKMAEQQMIPSVDVNMEFGKNEKGEWKTCFWFSNLSNFPVEVEIVLATGGQKHHINESNGGYFYLAPGEKGHRTNYSYDFWETNLPPHGTQVNLTIIAKCAFRSCPLKFSFPKAYRFHFEEMRWDESTWGCPDREFPPLSDVTIIANSIARITHELSEIKNNITKSE